MHRSDRSTVALSSPLAADPLSGGCKHHGVTPTTVMSFPLVIA
ncbi:hypothetical protein ACOQFL_08110 [Actinopolyspora sp. H202]